MCTPRLLRSSPNPFPRVLPHRRLLAGVASLTFLLVAACGDDDGGSPTPTRTYTVAIQQGDSQTTLDGTPVPISPTILVRDEQGAPAPGIGVSFTILSGDGSVSAPPQTLAGGLAPADWTLGWLRGNDTSATQQLRATVTGTHTVGDTVTFSAMATGNHWDSVPVTFGVVMSPAMGGVLNDRLYIINGYGAASWWITTSIFDPATGHFTFGAMLPSPSQVWDAASAVVNNHLYIAGGRFFVNGLPTRGLQVYDPATNQWSTMAPMLRARTGGRAAAVGGKIYVMGGVDSAGAPLALMEVYDTATNSWTALAPMPTARRHMGTAVMGGKIWVVGGLDAQAAPLATVEIYDPATDTWTTGTPLGVARQGPVVVVLNGLLYAVSGDAVPVGTMPTTEAWNPATNAWMLRHGFRWHGWNSVGGVIGGKIYTFGGEDGITWFSHVGVYTP